MCSTPSSVRRCDRYAYVDRKRLLPLLLFAVAASLLGAVLLKPPNSAHLGPPGGARTPATTATARTGGPGPVLGIASPSPSAPSGSRLALRFAFDGGLGGAVHDTEGLLQLRVKSAAGGSLTTFPHGDGLAVRFPPRCAAYATERCQRAVLQSGPAAFLNPARAPFRYGASVRLASNETSNGANVLQKGYSVGDSQFKLQVDGREGRPSCVLVGVGSRRIHVALSSVTVADGQWHRIECSRGDSLLTIAVDGKIQGQTAIPSSLSIVNKDPLCIGGKGTSVNNDQFAGSVDDVFITLDG